MIKEKIEAKKKKKKKQEKTNVMWTGDDLKLPALKTAFKSIVIFLQTEPIKTYRFDE
jgi:hypothetical protein